ncbi:ABC transporter ATP-binding protein [Candidatus Woesearchaeota archaeon]|nr:ABC transporter ATP-binding protein [Candidatus Woesearchaeota archaeon]MCF7900607.1 ABC transporter ATP-binding protein [Candidatus Woesearchaeota archaeon]MCF8013903.1 ABC transporter ATP-binding protein [Candidatus Woesearchaeota archaeon]
MNSIEIQGLVKKFTIKKKKEEVFAVNNISFNIKKGEIFGFLGPNGAGKTTTINCITQLSNKTSGKILVNGHDVEKQYREARNQIGLSPQDLTFDPYFTILEILVYQGGYFGMLKKQAQKRAEKLLKQFELWEKRKSRIKQLSGGMKRKLSIIKAMMHKPEILILDEPTAALDVDSRYELWEFIKKLNEQGITIILTTHYIEEAEKLADRIAIINKGKIIKLEEKEKIIEDLSQNKITIYLKEDKKLPKEFNQLNYDYKDKKIIIQTPKKDQNKNLRLALKILEEQKIEIENFSVDQDNLENIFRRLIKNENQN